MSTQPNARPGLASDLARAYAGVVLGVALTLGSGELGAAIGTAVFGGGMGAAAFYVVAVMVGLAATLVLAGWWGDPRTRRPRLLVLVLGALALHLVAGRWLTLPVLRALQLALPAVAVLVSRALVRRARPVDVPG